jgi:hypothetical protein
MVYQIAYKAGHPLKQQPANKRTPKVIQIHSSALHFVPCTGRQGRLYTNATTLSGSTNNCIPVFPFHYDAWGSNIVVGMYFSGE